MDEILSRANALIAQRTPFALVTVVWSYAPSSGKPGNRALVTADGELLGWVGGACARPAVLRECRRALEEGTPRLLCLGEDAHFPPPGRGRVHQPITCTSEGALEIFIDPQIPPAQLVVVGDTPVAATLGQLGRAIGMHVVAVVEGEQPPPWADDAYFDLDLDFVDGRTFVVVATMGGFDDEALRAALATEAAYVGLVASHKRAGAVRDLLGRQGLSPDQLDRVHAPAGLDLGRVPQEEIAVAILAEIVQLKALGIGAATAAEVEEPEQAVDPVCGMTVAVRGARYRMAWQGQTYTFCCGGCLEKFREDPNRYRVSKAG